MAKRVYWPAIAGTGGTLITALFIYLVAAGSIQILDHSGDVSCAGTDADPCYATITFKALDDIFVYPIGYDPYGRETLASFEPAVKKWELARSWGDGWKTYDLHNACDSSWCGAGASGSGTYSLAWRKGKEYTVRMKVWKNHPSDHIKWGFGDLDPAFLPAGSKRSIQILNKQTGDIIEETVKVNIIREWKEKCFRSPLNSSWQACVVNPRNETESSFIRTPGFEYQEVLVGGKLINMTGRDLYCFYNVSDVVCVSTLDGDGSLKSNKVKPGTSYITIPENSATEYGNVGHLRSKMDPVLAEARK